MEAARVLAEAWVAAWNSRDLDAVLEHYAQDVEFASPRVASAYHRTHGQVGSPGGVLRGVAALRPYFQQGIGSLPDLHMELQPGGLMQGPSGWYAMLYTRETGARVFESFRLGEPGGPDAAKMVEVRVFYDAVC